MTETDSASSTYYTIPNWTTQCEPTAAETAYFNSIDWSITSTQMSGSPKIGAMAALAPTITDFPITSLTSDFVAINKPVNLVCDPDSKEERYRTTNSIPSSAWPSVTKDNYGYTAGAAAASSSSSPTAAAPTTVKTGAPCTAPSGTVWLSVGEAMERSKAADLWQCISDQWTRVPTIFANTETSVLSINANMSIMSAAALAAAKRRFKKGYVPGSLPSSTTDDLATQRSAAPEVAIAGVTPMPEPVTAPILLAEAPKKSGRGGGRKRCVLFPREVKPVDPLFTPTGRPRKQTAKEKLVAAAKAKAEKKSVGGVATRKNARRTKTAAKEIHHVTVSAAPSIAAAPVVIPSTAAPAATTPTVADVSSSVFDVTPWDFEEIVDTRPDRAATSSMSSAAMQAMGDYMASRAATKLVTKVEYETYLVDEFGNEVKLSDDGTLNGVPVIVRDEFDITTTTTPTDDDNR